jgi:hypothetical protein
MEMGQKIRKQDRKRFRVFPDRFLGIPFSVGKIPYFKNRMKYGKSPASLLWPISRLPDFIPRSSKLGPQLRFTGRRHTRLTAEDCLEESVVKEDILHVELLNGSVKKDSSDEHHVNSG